MTGQEVRIARLAAAGLGTAGIAERLGVDPEAAESGLARALAKLGAGSPAGLAPALAAAGAPAG
ncbi:hypothetical protein ACWCXH_37460 [Kitasatospora sp. NPDC001660]